MSTRRTSKRHAFVAALACLSALSACGSATPAGSSARALAQPTSIGTPVGASRFLVIAPDTGGSLTSDDGRATLAVPVGATDAPVDFTVQTITNLAPGGIGNAYRLGPSGMGFLRPVELTFLAGSTGKTVDQLAVMYQESAGYWVRALNLRRDATAQTVTAVLSHFSDWALVSADPSQDLAGTFTLRSTLDIPFNAQGTAQLTYYGQDATERVYVFSGTTTLLLPVPPTGTACTVDEPLSRPFPTNVAEVLSSPDRFWWGTSVHWNVTCNNFSTFLTGAFDTEGLNLTNCNRTYLPTPVSPTPIITADRVQGSYVIDCAAKGSIAATWDFQRCGGTCTAPLCQTAAFSCASGTAVCTPGPNVTNGTACGTNLVCGGGQCNACTKDATCPLLPPQNPCHVGTTTCDTGSPVCTDTLQNVQNGTSCGTGQVCLDGACTGCVAGQSCTPPSNPCHAGLTSCSTGIQLCADQQTNVDDGTSCGTNQACHAGTCGACTAGASCTLVDACVTAATISCSTGLPVCTATPGAIAADGSQLCGSGTVTCQGGSCVDTPCQPGVACVPTNPCVLGTVSCGDPTAVPPTSTTCVASTTAAPDGTTCGTNLVCSTGSCLACPGSAGTVCQSTNPCAVSAAITCDAAGVPTCTDQRLQPDGTVCNGTLTCVAGVCQ